MERKGKNTAAAPRYRNFGCLVYPESAPEGWKDMVSDLHVAAFISPLHDKDMDPQNQPKKPHYHVMLMYEGKKSRQQIEEVFASFGASAARLSTQSGVMPGICATWITRKRCSMRLRT